MNFKDTEIGRIPFEWDVRMIQDVAEVVSGATPKTKVAEYWDGNIAWITPKDLSNHTERYIYRGDRMITDEGLKNSSAKLLPKGSVLFSSRAPIGYTAIAAQELCTNQGFKSMICNQQILDNNFMFYMMNYKKNEIENIAGGSTFKEVSGKTVKEFKIPIPPLDEQKAIAKVLSDLDEKIETNNKINKKLEEMAQAIFKQWFVDFEFTNEDGKPYKSSGGEMIESELGMIPLDWEVNKLQNIIDLVKENTKSGEHLKDRKYVPIDTMPMKTLVLNDFKSSDEANSSLILFNKFDILIGAMRVYFHRVNLAAFNGVTRTTTFVLRSKRETDIAYNLLLLNLDETINYASNTSKGSTMPYAVWENGLGNMSVVYPPENLRAKFNNVVLPVLKNIINNNEENIILKNIRDTLLPKLMSGEIRVPID